MGGRGGMATGALFPMVPSYRSCVQTERKNLVSKLRGRPCVPCVDAWTVDEPDIHRKTDTSLARKGGRKAAEDRLASDRSIIRI